MVAQPKYTKKPAGSPIRATKTANIIPFPQKAAVSFDRDAAEFEELAALMDDYNLAVKIRHETPRDHSDDSYEVSLNIFRANYRILQFYDRVKYPYDDNHWRKVLHNFYANHRDVHYSDVLRRYVSDKDWLSLDAERQNNTEETHHSGLAYIFERGKELGFPELCLDPGIQAYCADLPEGMPTQWTIAAGEENWRWVFKHMPIKRQPFMINCAEFVLRK